MYSTTFSDHIFLLLLSRNSSKVETDTDEELIRQMQTSAAGTLKIDGKDKGFVGVFYDSKLAGEASAQPHIRQPPLREAGEHLRRLAGLRLRAKSESEICDRDIWFVPDAGKDGNKSVLLSPFQGKEKVVRELHVWFEQKSLELRLEKVRGFMALNQAEKIHMITQKSLDLVEHDRLHFAGTNRGNCIGPIAMPTFDDAAVWKVNVKIKREIIGKHGGKVLVGGGLLIPGATPEDIKKLSEPPKFATADEPVFYHATPICLDEELMHSYELRAVFCLTAGSGEMALTCLRNRRPYFGICLSTAHKEALLARLEKLVWASYQQSGDKLYESGLVDLIKASKKDENGDDIMPDPAVPKKMGKKRVRGGKTGVADPADQPKNPKDLTKDSKDLPPTKKGVGANPQSKADLLAKIAKLTGHKAGASAASGVDEEPEDSKSEHED